MVKVLIVEDHDMARLGLSVILSKNPNIEICEIYLNLLKYNYLNCSIDEVEIDNGNIPIFNEDENKNENQKENCKILKKKLLLIDMQILN